RVPLELGRVPLAHVALTAHYLDCFLRDSTVPVSGCPVQRGNFIYKARQAGIPLVFVDPAYSPKECAECGQVDRLNRISQAKFVCRSCGVVAHADRNASRVLAHRGEDAWTAGRESRVPATP
ncbi:transposase, partial [Streptomyces gibsoniae]